MLIERLKWISGMATFTETRTMQDDTLGLDDAIRELCRRKREPRIELKIEL